MRSFKKIIQPVLFSLLFVPSALHAQVTSATILGAVHDTTGAVIPHAKVVAVESTTGAQVTAESNDAGEYTLPFLKPGDYTITVQQAGFSRYERKNVTLLSGDHPAIDISLAVGDTGMVG